MSSQHRLTRSFRTLSAMLYILNTVVSIHFLVRHAVYLHVVVCSLVSLISMVMFCVAIESPTPVVSRLENSRLGETLFTFRGRYMVDLLSALFLFALGPWGFVMALATLFLIFGIRFIGVKNPDAFNEIFRQSDIESQSQGDSYTMEGTYDTEMSK